MILITNPITGKKVNLRFVADWNETIYQNIYDRYKRGWTEEELFGLVERKSKWRPKSERDKDAKVRRARIRRTSIQSRNGG